MKELPKRLGISSLNREKGSDMKKKYRFLFFLIGIAGFAVLALQTKPDKEDWQTLITPELPFILLGLLVLWTAIYILHTVAYRLIIGNDSGKINPFRLFWVCVSGFALNEVTPLGMVGGEPYRIMALKQKLGTEKATSVTLTFSVLYIIGHVLIWITGVLIYLFSGCPGEPAMTAALLFVMFLLLAVCVAFFNLKNSGIILPILRRLSKIPLLKKWIRPLLDKKGSQIEYIDMGFVNFRKDPAQFTKAVLCEFGSRVLEGMEYFLIFRYLDVPVSVFGGILILSMASLIGNLLFIVPMQAGTREGGMAIAVEWLGIEPATGMMGGLLYRMRYIICILIGVICILINKGISSPEQKME